MENPPIFQWVNQLEIAIFNSKLLVYQRVRLPYFETTPEVFLGSRSRNSSGLQTTHPEPPLGCWYPLFLEAVTGIII